MAKIVRILAILFLAVGLFGYDKFLDTFDDKFNKSSISVKRQMHNELKNVYLKISTSKDKGGRIEALKKLVSSSKALGYNSKSYENELQRLGINIPQNSVKIISQNKNRDDELKKIADAKPTSPDILNKNKKQKLVQKNTNKKDRQNIKIGKTETKISSNQKKSDIRTYTKKSNKKISPQDNKIDDETLAVAAPVVNTSNLKHSKGKIIVIDAGHGGKDPGATGNDLKEKNIVFSIACQTAEILKKRGYKVYLTRNKDVFWNLQSRTKFANRKHADMFISIHANAAPNKKAAASMQGVETFFLSPARSERSKRVATLENSGDLEDMNSFSKETFLNFLNREKIIASNKLAIDIQSYMLHSLRRSFSSKDGGVREAPFWVLVGAQMPAVLVEVGYITHPKEGKNLGNKTYQKLVAVGISDGVSAYFMKN